MCLWPLAGGQAQRRCCTSRHPCDLHGHACHAPPSAPSKAPARRLHQARPRLPAMHPLQRRKPTAALIGSRVMAPEPQLRSQVQALMALQSDEQEDGWRNNNRHVCQAGSPTAPSRRGCQRARLHCHIGACSHGREVFGEGFRWRPAPSCGAACSALLKPAAVRRTSKAAIAAVHPNATRAGDPEW